MAKPYFEIRRSGIHGRGAFALRAIPKGRRIAEYTGERITHAEAKRRYDDEDDAEPTYLFTVDRWLVVDARHQGSDARYINHGCDPNCESVIAGRRVFIETIEDVAKGAELTYDYSLYVEKGRTVDPAKMRCGCGAASCRGTLLAEVEKPRKRRRRR